MEKNLSNNYEKEYFSVVDENDNIIGVASRAECHGNPSFIHRVAHILVFTLDGKLILQKRSLNKDVQPGKWDTSVGGHLKPGEDYETAAYRELKEELGIEGENLEFLYKYPYRDKVESENVGTFKYIYNGPLNVDSYEIMEAREWDISEIKNSLGKGIFTPHFEAEFKVYLSYGGNFG